MQGVVSSAASHGRPGFEGRIGVEQVGKEGMREKWSNRQHGSSEEHPLSEETRPAGCGGSCCWSRSAAVDTGEVTGEF